MNLTQQYQPLPRITTAMISAALVTLAMLLFMHQLIKMETPVTAEPSPHITVPIMTPDPVIKVIKNTKPKLPPPPAAQPKQTFDPIPAENTLSKLAIAPPIVDGTIKLSLEAGTGNAVSMMQVAPNYPERARSKGIEGYVDLIFDLTATGQTQNIRILKAEPKGYFENASIRALSKWKYKPAMEDGIAIAMHNMTTRISYNLEN